SGADGGVIRTIQGAPGTGLGAGVGAAGDVDGDGVPDVVLHRAPDDPPPPFIPGPTVLSGFDGSFIRSYASGTASHLGGRVAGIGDLDRDGRADLVVGDLRPDVYSGATGAKLLRVAQEASQATPVGDTDLDGYPDLILGKGDSALGGTVRVVSLIPCSPECEDADWDGYGAPPGPACAFAEPDCDNADREVFPGATEVCDNLIDDDCDGAADADDSDCSACGWVWYEDLDGDAWGNPERATIGCGPYDHHVGRSEDCDDTRNWVNPVAREIPGNDVDENCNGSVACGSLPPGASPWPAALAFAPFAWFALRRRGRK
ncbi:MAG: putative metal-binding motif-containing protein, partial [Candidatus Methylomirabilis sp.]|nr:putative metal-binding motif-containing protein [Deltaproteobacteria bacterium]